MPDTPVFSKEQVLQYLVRYHHLTDDTALAGAPALAGYVQAVGCIQFDPLDVVGRNADLTLQARSKSYRRGDVDALLYRDRLLFDVWDKNMSIAAVSDWPYYAHERALFLPWLSEHKAAVKEITDYLAVHECANSSDFSLEDAVRWHYGPQRTAKAVLECLCYAGRAVVHHKQGTRRFYALAERCVPAELLRAAPHYADEPGFLCEFVLRRIRGVGILWNRPSDAFLGFGGYIGKPLTAAQRSAAFSALLATERIMPVSIEGIRQTLYVPADALPLLETAGPVPERTARFLAPLDPMLWDRKLIEALTGFTYRWEVYVPASQRKYGYYVLPVLLGSRLIGRIELVPNPARTGIAARALWWEHPLKKREQAAVERGLKRFDAYWLGRKNGR